MTTPKTKEVAGVTLHLSPPAKLDMKWVGDDALVEQLLACWLPFDSGDNGQAAELDPTDIPLSPRLIGQPGVGKTTLAYAAASSLGRPVYLFQATQDTRPEDLVVTPVLESGQSIRYVASGIVSAMLTGGTVILDEGNRMAEKSWASLAPLLDARRYVESLIAGITIKAHPNFRFVATMNDDASTFDLPEYINSRLQPRIYVDFPSEEEELEILQANVPHSPEDLLRVVVRFLQLGHNEGEAFTVRDGIHILRYALKRAAFKEGGDPADFLHESVSLILGEDKAEMFGVLLEDNPDK